MSSIKHSRTPYTLSIETFMILLIGTIVIVFSIVDTINEGKPNPVVLGSALTRFCIMIWAVWFDHTHPR